MYMKDNMACKMLRTSVSRLKYNKNYEGQESLQDVAGFYVDAEINSV